MHAHAVCTRLFSPPAKEPGYEAFSCIASGANSFLWRVNETDIDMLPHQLGDDIITEVIFSHIDVSTLAIKTRVAYNGTRVQCVVTGGGGSVESDTATLTIQGMVNQLW